MKKIIMMMISIILLTFCSGLYYFVKKGEAQSKGEVSPTELKKDFNFEVLPETFQIMIEAEGTKEQVSDPLPVRQVTNLKKTDNLVSWSYPQENMDVTITKEKNYLDVKIQTNQVQKFTWPMIRGDSYVLPISEGKYIPSHDEVWKKFLKSEKFIVNEWFSMKFFAVNKEKYSVVYVIQNMLNNEIEFNNDPNLIFSFSHEFPSTNKEKEYGFRIYITTKDAVDMANIYKQYLQEKNEFTTLDEKAQSNENIKKLYGAPHIYLWGNGNSLTLLHDIQASGIRKAWLGFSDWMPGLSNPEFVKQANEQGYLIGPYDSYHSIHEKGNSDWITAQFSDTSLYENATVTNKQGKKVAGFLGRGRKLNPTLSLPSVKERVTAVLSTGVQFNSWFIDCDAAGEIYDDYSLNHITTQREDIQARLGRMNYIRDTHHMVIGSEQGNDYASQTIAFAHGLETPVIWGDVDMRKNRQSPYYVGDYWSKTGGIPSKYVKQVPLKEEYRHIYIDPVYSVPLFKLVYNNSVITTHHWEWGSLKIKNEVQNRMLNEVLYNIPPLYHLDKVTWHEQKNIILPHLKVWSPFHEKAVTKEMTNFKILSADRLVQMTEFGQELQVIANFSEKDFTYQDTMIKRKSLIIYDSNHKTIYIPYYI